MSDAANPALSHVPNIYFIDDSATMREVIKIAFRKENIHVVACHDGASALELFAEARPDCVITDVIMPEKDGYEVCRFVKQHSEFKSTPVILMSGVVNRQVAEKAMEAGADELMRKPFQPQELVAKVKSLLYPKASSDTSEAEYPRRGTFDSPGSFAEQPVRSATNKRAGSKRIASKRAVCRIRLIRRAARRRSAGAALDSRAESSSSRCAAPSRERDAKRKRRAAETARRRSPPGNAGKEAAIRIRSRAPIQLRTGNPATRPARIVAPAASRRFSVALLVRAPGTQRPSLDLEFASANCKLAMLRPC